MPRWYYDREELRRTPSIKDGIDYKTECRYRMEGARFIFDTGTKLGLGYNTMATGVMYFHRFYMFHSFRVFHRYVTAAACIFLAGKVEETPKLFEHIITTARTLLNDKELRKFGRNPRKEIMTAERILLHTIKFDLLIEHPNNYVPKYAKCLKGNRKKIEKIVQSAWNFASDSLYTTLALQWEPEIIAIAFMYLAGKLSNFTLVDWKGRLRWWDTFVADLPVNLLEDICHQLLDSYSQADKAKSSELSPASASANNSGRHNAAVVPCIKSTSGTPNVIPCKIPQIDSTICPQTTASRVSSPAEPMDTSRFLELPFSPHPEKFPPTVAFPVGIPPADFSIPPPPLPPVLLGSCLQYTNPPGSNTRLITSFSHSMCFTPNKPPTGDSLRHQSAARTYPSEL